MKAVNSFSVLRRWLGASPLLGLALLLSSLAALQARAQSIDLPVFRQDIAFPKDAPTGAILGRHEFTLTPETACSSSECELFQVVLIRAGGTSMVGLSEVDTQVQGIGTRIFINGVQQRSTSTSSSSTTPTVLRFSEPLHVEIQLFRMTGFFKPGSLKPANGRTPVYFLMQSRKKPGGENGPVFRIMLAGDVSAVEGSCRVISQTVRLPAIMPSQLQGPGIGADVAQRDFSVQVNDCPAGFHSVRYQFIAKGTPDAGTVGTLPLLGGSSASGVGVQIRDGLLEPVPLRQRRWLDSYDPGHGGDYEIPLNATYVRTGPANVGLGSVKAAMEVWLDYD